MHHYICAINLIPMPLKVTDPEISFLINSEAQRQIDGSRTYRFRKLYKR